MLPSSLAETNSPIIVSPSGPTTPTNGRILYIVPPYNSHQSVPINPSSSDPLEELSSSNSSPRDSLESLSPPPSPDEKETPNNLPVQVVKKPVLSVQPMAKPVLPAQPVTKPVSPTQPVTKPFLQIQPVAELVQPVEIPVSPIQKLEITTKTTEPVSPQETTPTKEEKKVVSILKKTSNSPYKYLESIDSATTTISSSTLLSGLSLTTSKLSSAKRVRFFDDLQTEEKEAEIAINGFSEEFSPSTNASTPKVKISLLNSQGTNTSIISPSKDEPDTTIKTSLDKTPTDDDINALWSQINGYLHYHKHSNGTDTKVNSTPQLTRRCHNAHQPIKLWRRHGSTQYIEVDQSNGQNMSSVKPSKTIVAMTTHHCTLFRCNYNGKSTFGIY